ncbi:unnamed protein product [Rotaria sp. Silwood2]|nr:unnamed protein product [Rotaria sp. Silwood2]CAF3407726.1 unnamed protein product [Rotaria sp. Silwood2]CAF3930469.1 unnamed protein product [Rotaria sp. Silwood2]CAF4444653.1 unnamed protein product [Rotaria sp. Silwood2]
MADPDVFVDPDTGEEYRVGGCLISGEPSDLPKFGTFRLVSDAQLPYSVDLRQFMTPIEYQGSTNSCWLFNLNYPNRKQSKVSNIHFSNF